jgi:uncharacterized membrane protein YoaK (UPF0700 family)
VVFAPRAQRRFREDLLLAVLFAAVSGAVNSIGLVRLGAFVSHITGAATNFGGALAGPRPASAIEPLLLMLAFGGGSFLVGLLHSAGHGLGRARYAVGLGVEVVVLLLFTALDAGEGARMTGLSLLCFAMGLQNALGTSAAAVRSTHLTGLMTDLGLDVAQWVAGRDGVGPGVPRLALHAATLCAFLTGAAAGAAAVVAFGAPAVLGPAAVLVALAAWDAAHLRRTRA